MVRVGKVKYIYIYSNGDNRFVVHNTRKEFQKGHTHVNSFKTAEYLALLAVHKSVPKKHRLPNYLRDSLIRISEDEKYIEKVKTLTNKKKKNKD